MTMPGEPMPSFEEKTLERTARWLGRLILAGVVFTAGLMVWGTGHGATLADAAPKRPGAVVAQLQLVGPKDPVLVPHTSQALAFELRLDRALSQPVTVEWVLEPAPSGSPSQPLPARWQQEPWPTGALTIPAFSTRASFTVPVARAGERGDTALHLRLRRVQGPVALAQSFHSLQVRDAREHLSPAAAAQAAKAKEQFPIFEQLLAYLGAQRRMGELLVEGGPPSPATQMQLRSLDQLSAQIRQAMLQAELGQRAPLTEAELKRLTDTLLATMGPKP